MSDLEKMKKLYDDLGIAYEITSWEDEDEDIEIGCKELTLGVEGGWFWTVFQFKDDEYVNYFTTE